VEFGSIELHENTSFFYINKKRLTLGEVFLSETEQYLGAAKRNRLAFIVWCSNAGLFFFSTSIGPFLVFTGNGTTPAHALHFLVFLPFLLLYGDMLPRRMQCSNLVGSAVGAMIAFFRT
jgi:hypothetical protein